jgi:hypothetical protein
MDTFQTGIRDRLFFMHIPKTAGMSMRQYLGEQYHPHEICSAERWQDILGLSGDLASFRLVRGHFRYNLRSLVAPDARMLVVLREPVRRTISALRHLIRDPDFHPTHELAKNRRLGELIRDPDVMSFQRDVQSRFLCASRSPDAVAAYFDQASLEGRTVDAGDLEEPPAFQLAADRLETIDFIGITEDIGSVVSTMAEAMSYHPPRYFPFINHDPEHDDPLSGLTDEEVAIVREHNAVDRRLYDFARKLIDWRQFESAMRGMVRNGIYQVLPGSFEITMDGIMPGSGWYHTEREGDAAWRWTGPGQHFSIEVPLRSDASYRFGMTFHDPRPAGPEHMAVEINDFPMEFDVWPEDDRFRCEFDIDQALLRKSSGLCRIRIETGEPIRVGHEDIRPLGILVRRIDFTCLEA